MITLNSSRRPDIVSPFGGESDVLLFSHPSSEVDRANLTVLVQGYLIRL
jgi:hypothetical protein